MNETWEKAIKLVLDYEGRTYENDPKDLGGETKFGISKKAYPSIDIRNLTEDEAKAIYRRDYWDAVMGDQLPDKLAISVFDCAVNQGTGRAIRLLQSVLEIEADGKIGPQTLAAAKASDDNTAWMYLLQRARLYMGTKTVEYWGANWGLRLVKLAREIFPKV